MPIEDQEGGSSSADPHCSSMVNPTMVSGSPVDALSETYLPTEAAISVTKSQQRAPSSQSDDDSSRLARVRSSLHDQGISGQATTLILSSWRKNTESAYSCSWQKWEQWCSRHGHNPICASLSAVLDFLASEYAEGKQYRTLNSYRSAISMTHTTIDGVVVRKHPLVSRLMKGVFNSRPPQPRYAFTWDVGRVLDPILSLGETQRLSLKSHKLAVLLALSNASRVSVIHALDIRFLRKNQDGVSFTIAELTKTAHPGKKRVMHYLSLKEERRLCPVTTLEEYLHCTA